jgi:SAM-dependent methyltransferase
MHDQISIDHFDSIAARYAGSVEALKPLYDAVREELNGLVAGKSVLDVGNGGIFPYDRSLASSVTALDISEEMLKRIPEGVRKICSDARDMKACEDESFDVVIFNLSLHHIAAGTLDATQEGLRRALAEGWRTLRPGGDLIVYEPALGSALHALGRALFRPVRAALALAGVPMVFFQSRASLTRLLAEAGGLEPAAVSVTAAPVTGWSDPLGGTFPGHLLLPTALYPTRFELFRVTKPRG